MASDREAMFWRKLPDGRVACELCAQRCELAAGHYGVCGARRHVGGRLVSVSYGRLIAVHVDPIEKKPLFHYQPGSRSFSVATCGCNLRCDFCQNYSISQHRDHDGEGCLEGEEVPAEEVARQALAARCRSISYTYTEPTVFYEYCRDVGVLARRAGLGNVFVTNGMMMPPSPTMPPRRSSTPRTSTSRASPPRSTRPLQGQARRRQGGARAAVGRGVWVEVTTLVIPGRNDGDEELRAIAKYLVSLSPDLPWHLSRFHPDYRVDRIPPTPVERLLAARAIGLAEGLRHVYVGNVPAEDGESTRCHSAARS